MFKIFGRTAKRFHFHQLIWCFFILEMPSCANSRELAHGDIGAKNWREF